jgi:hypothetical protein
MKVFAVDVIAAYMTNKETLSVLVHDEPGKMWLPAMNTA